MSYVYSIAQPPDTNADGTIFYSAPATLSVLGTLQFALHVPENQTIALMPLPSEAYIIITHIVLKDPSEAVTATFGFGYDTNCTDVVAQQTFSNLSAAHLYSVITPITGALSYNSISGFAVKCSNPQVSGTLWCDIIGYYYTST